MGHERENGQIRAFLHTIWWRRVDLYSYSSCFRLIYTPLRLQQHNHDDQKLKYASFVVYICVPSVNYAVASSYADQGLPTHHMVAESRPLQLKLLLPPHQYNASTTATQPWRSKAKVRIICRLYMCAKRKLRSSKLLCRSGPSYIPYGCAQSTSTLQL